MVEFLNSALPVLYGSYFGLFTSKEFFDGRMDAVDGLDIVEIIIDHIVCCAVQSDSINRLS